MATPPVWARQTYVFYTTALGAVDAKHSTAFIVPEACQTISFIFPALATDIAVTLEGLSPLDKTTWTAVKVAVTPATVTAISFVVSTTVVSYTVMPAMWLGTGTFRFVNATDQTTVVPVQILFDRYTS